VSGEPLQRRELIVAGVQRLGAYHVLRVADTGGPEPLAGQFAMLAAMDGWGGGQDERPFLSRALSIARREDGHSLFLLEDVGPGTARLCAMTPGDHVRVLGPLGKGFTAPEDGRRPLLAGGGAGIAPLAILQDQLPGTATALLGFRGSGHAAGAAMLREAQIATDDGSVGHRGTVTRLLAGELESDPHAAVYACGPAAMLESVRALCEDAGVPAQLALEAPMACGFGACHGCVVPLRGGRYLRVCVDGPVIDASRLESVEAHAGSPA
jgi:NAD(P)H-flavin reductase